MNLCPDLLETFDPGTSLYQKLAEQYRIHLVVTNEVIEVGKATDKEARLMHVAPQSPVFLFTRLSFLENGRPVEYVKSVYRGDRYKIVNRLVRSRRELRPPFYCLARSAKTPRSPDLPRQAPRSRSR